jgi:protein SCO1
MRDVSWEKGFGKTRIGLVLVALAISAWGQGMGRGIMAPAANVRPPGLNDVGIEQRLNEQVPANLSFVDESGRPVKLADYFGKRPIILNLVYYRCPMLCGEVLSGLTSALKPMSLEPGKDFDVLTVSFDPHETPLDATASKAEYLKRYRRAGAERGWHFLTGSQASIDALTKAVGFQYHYDSKIGQFAHTTAIMILTPEGRIAQYYYGVEFSPKDLRLALVQASQNKVGNVVDQILLYCYHYDPASGRYSMMVTRVLQLAALATVVFLGGFIFIMVRRESTHDVIGAGRIR